MVGQRAGATALLGALLATVAPVWAVPPYQESEAVPCLYCHQEPDGGPRNYRGIFYSTHRQSFQGFDDAREAREAGVAPGPFADRVPRSLRERPTPAPPTPAPPLSPAQRIYAAQRQASAAQAALRAAPREERLQSEAVAALLALGDALLADPALARTQKTARARAAFEAARAIAPTETRILRRLQTLDTPATRRP